jgi:hypothetical protein
MNQADMFTSKPTISGALVLNELSHHIGQSKGISGRDLARRVVGPQAGAADERRLRQVITELRLEGHHICGRPESGYYLAEDAADLDRTCLFLYHRAMASLTQIARMKRIAEPDLRGQLHLPT